MDDHTDCDKKKIIRIMTKKVDEGKLNDIFILAVLDKCLPCDFSSSLKYDCRNIFSAQADQTSMLQRGQCEKKNQNHQGVPQPCLE